MLIRKTIIPAAGLGTRFLPLTKTLPKEMLPLLNKPAIQYVVEEAMQSDISHLVMITNRDRDSLMDYFDTAIHLNSFLSCHGKEALMKSLDDIIHAMQFTYIRQAHPRGLGHAILTADAITNQEEYIGIILPDDIIIGKEPGLKQLITIARQEKASVIAVQEVPTESLSSYGVIAIEKQEGLDLFRISDLVEKPSAQNAPSNLAIIGRYVLSGKIFEALKTLPCSDNREMQLTDGISRMIKSGEPVYAYRIQGQRYDIGTPTGWLQAIVSLALQDPSHAQHIIKTLHEHSLSVSNN